LLCLIGTRGVTAEFATKPTSGTIVIVTVSRAASVIIVIVTISASSATAIVETVVSLATDGAARDVTASVSFKSSPFSGAHTRVIGYARLIGLCQQEAGRVRARQ